MLYLHPPPVHLSALLLLLELKARNSKDVEEAVAHHGRNGIINSEETLSEAGERKKEEQDKIIIYFTIIK